MRTAAGAPTNGSPKVSRAGAANVIIQRGNALRLSRRGERIQHRHVAGWPLTKLGECIQQRPHVAGCPRFGLEPKWLQKTPLMALPLPNKCSCNADLHTHKKVSDTQLEHVRQSFDKISDHEQQHWKVSTWIPSKPLKNKRIGLRVEIDVSQTAKSIDVACQHLSRQETHAHVQQCLEHGFSRF